MTDPALAAQLIAAPPTQQNNPTPAFEAKGPPLPSCGYPCHCPTWAKCWRKIEAVRLGRDTRVGEWGTD